MPPPSDDDDARFSGAQFAKWPFPPNPRSYPQSYPQNYQRNYPQHYQLTYKQARQQAKEEKKRRAKNRRQPPQPYFPSHPPTPAANYPPQYPPSPSSNYPAHYRGEHQGNYQGAYPAYPPRQFPPSFPQNYPRGYPPNYAPGYPPSYPHGYPAQYPPRRRRRSQVRLNIGLGVVVLIAVAGLVLSMVNPASLGALGDLIADSPTPVEPPASTSENSPAHSPPTIADPSDAYEFWYINDYEDGEPIPARWSSCEPIRYQINPESGDEYFIDWVHATVSEVSEATGLEFSYEGLTYAEPKMESDLSDFNYFEELPPVTIQFASEEQIPDLEGNIEGLAVLQQVESPRTGNTRYVAGQVFLDETLLTDRNVNREPAYVHVLRHELAHIVGLGHVEDLDELMHEAPVVHDFGPGDLTGLSQLGGGPCD